MSNYEDNKVPLTRYFWAFILASFLMASVFLVSYGISYWNYQIISSSNNEIFHSLNEIEKILNTSQCQEDNLYYSSEILDRTGQRLNLLETRFGKNDERVLSQKKLYSQLEYKHFQLVKLYVEKCSANFVTLLFFYSNDDFLGEESESVGYILSTIKKTYSNKAMIYSFDINLDDEVIDNFKEIYGFVDVPFVIVNKR